MFLSLQQGDTYVCLRLPMTFSLCLFKSSSCSRFTSVFTFPRYIRTPSYWIRAYPTTSFELDHLWKDAISEERHMLSSWRLGFNLSSGPLFGCHNTTHSNRIVTRAGQGGVVNNIVGKGHVVLSKNICVGTCLFHLLPVP